MQALVMDEVAAIRQEIAATIGSQKYSIWFKNSTQLSLVDEYLKISVPNKFIANWIEKHFSRDIKNSVQNVKGIDIKLAFNIDPDLSVKAGSSDKNPVSTPKQSKIAMQSLKPHSKVEKVAKRKGNFKLALEDYVVGSCNMLAYNAAKVVSEKPGSVFNPLFIHGSYGIGKTHLLQGVCSEVSKAKPDAKCIYISAEEFTNQYVMALKNRQLDNFRNKFRNADVLAIDDIHFLANKKSTQEEFLHTFNSIDLANKQVVLASDAHPKMIEQLTESLVSRFVSGMVVKIEKPDFETRLTICKQRASKMNVSISDEVLEYTANKVSKSIRELEGALLKLSAFATVAGGSIDLKAAKSILADSITNNQTRITIKSIVNEVCDIFGTTKDQIDSASKARNVSLARAFCMYIARENTDMAYAEIGKQLGKKNHATVIQSCKKIAKLIENNDKVSWKSGNEKISMLAKEVASDIEKKITE